MCTSLEFLDNMCIYRICTIFKGTVASVLSLPTVVWFDRVKLGEKHLIVLNFSVAFVIFNNKHKKAALRNVQERPKYL